MTKSTVTFNVKLDDKFEFMKGEVETTPNFVKIKNTNGTVYRVPWWNVISIKEDKKKDDELKESAA